jgi:ATP-dependent Lon protease
VGGDILFIEATAMPGAGLLSLTGQLGDVMKESSQAALSYLRSRAESWGIAADYFRKHDLHVHVPEGATPKDGPSAGVAIFSALVSLLVQKPIKSTLAMTGEMTLRGLVLPVGGIKEKVLAAKRAGIRTVLLPDRNRKDIEEIPKNIRSDMTFHYVTRVEEVLPLALADGWKPGAAIDGPAGKTIRRRARREKRPKS